MYAVGSVSSAAIGGHTQFNPSTRASGSEFAHSAITAHAAAHALFHRMRDAHSQRQTRQTAIARQDLRPVWLSKPGFFALGSLRAYPVGQLHRLTEVLQLRELPWAQPEVITVIRQTLYQLGTLVEREGAVQQLWRTDWTDGGGTLAALSSELEQLADELAQTPRSHDDVLLLGEIAAYLSQWHGCSLATRTARIFAAMTRRAADELDSSIADAVGAAAQSQLQARQCKLRMLSLLCYGPGALSGADDAAAVVQLIVQVKHDHVFFTDVPEAEDAHLRALHVRCHNVTARHAAAVGKIWYSGQGHKLLRDAAARVLGEERTPAVLSWLRLGWTRAAGRDESGSYEVESGGHLYSINVLDGEVLLDGFPPGRLPKVNTPESTVAAVPVVAVQACICCVLTHTHCTRLPQDYPQPLAVQAHVWGPRLRGHPH
jgi:hypothetical protein